MFFKEILIVVLMSSMTAVVMSQSKDFCEAFADNGFDIDYAYKRGYFFLIIGHHYWEVSDQMEFTDNTRRSRIIGDWFGNHYNIAFHYQNCNEKYTECQQFSGLMKKVNNLMITSNVF